MRQVLGALIWLHRTRPDIGFDITKIATDSAAACEDVDISLETLMIYNRTARFVKDYGRKLVYSSHGRSGDSFVRRWRRFQTMRLIVFNDA